MNYLYPEYQIPDISPALAVLRTSRSAGCDHYVEGLGPRDEQFIEGGDMTAVTSRKHKLRSVFHEHRLQQRACVTYYSRSASASLMAPSHMRMGAGGFMVTLKRRYILVSKVDPSGPSTRD